MTVRLAGVGLATLTVALALLAAGLSAPAMAAVPAASPAPTGLAFGVAAAATPPTTITTAYTCDLGTGIPAATLSATLTIPASVVAVSALDISLATTVSSALPASVVTKLAGVTSFDLAGQLTQQPGSDGTSTSSPVPLGGTATAPATLTTLPVMTATGTADFQASGNAVIVAPATTLTITPHTSSTALDAITCTSTTATTQNVKVLVTPKTYNTNGPLYTCVQSVGAIVANTIYAHIAATITAAGTHQTGQTVTVTYDTNAWGAWPPQTTALEFTGSLPVIGAQPGQVSINESARVSDSDLSVSGKLKLTKAGTDRILMPQKFTLVVTLSSQGVSIAEKNACTLTTTPTPVGLTLAVKKASGGPHPTTSPTPSRTPTATPTISPTPTPTPTQSGIPTGGADTGGGTGAGVSLGVVAAGGAIALSGGGLVLFGRRRNRRGSRAGRD